MDEHHNADHLAIVEDLEEFATIEIATDVLFRLVRFEQKRQMSTAIEGSSDQGNYRHRSLLTSLRQRLRRLRRVTHFGKLSIEQPLARRNPDAIFQGCITAPLPLRSLVRSVDTFNSATP